jgi:hypothetical protein
MDTLFGFHMGRHYDEPDQYRTVGPVPVVFWASEFSLFNNRHEQILRSTIERLLRDASGLHDQEDGWNLIREKQGVKLYRKKSQKIRGKRTIDSMRGVGTFKVDPKNFCDLVTDLHEGRKKIDAMFKHGRVVEQVDPHTAIVHYEMKAEKCIVELHRDFLFLQHVRELGDGVWIIASRSAGVNQSLISSPPGAERGELLNSGYVVRPRKGGMCDICYVVQVELGSIPETVVNIAAKQQPMVIARAAAHLQSLQSSTIPSPSAKLSLSPRREDPQRTRRGTEDQFSDLVSSRQEDDQDCQSGIPLRSSASTQEGPASSPRGRSSPRDDLFFGFANMGHVETKDSNKPAIHHSVTARYRPVQSVVLVKPVIQCPACHSKQEDEDEGMFCFACGGKLE